MYIYWGIKTDNETSIYLLLIAHKIIRIIYKQIQKSVHNRLWPFLLSRPEFRSFDTRNNTKVHKKYMKVSLTIVSILYFINCKNDLQPNLSKIVFIAGWHLYKYLYFQNFNEFIILDSMEDLFWAGLTNRQCLGLAIRLEALSIYNNRNRY